MKEITYEDGNGDSQLMQWHATHSVVHGDEFIDQGDYDFNTEEEEELGEPAPALVKTTSKRKATI